MSADEPILVLIVDDEAAIRESIRDYLSGEGIRAETASGGTEALARLAETEIPLVLTDLRMGGMDGLTLLRKGRSISPKTIFAVLTAYGSLQTAIDALRAGAVDFLLKPVVFEDLLNRVRRILDHRDALRENIRLKDLLHRCEPPGGIVGRSPAMQRALQLVRQYGATDLPVLVTGPSGTGKELIARELHRSSSRRDGVFLAVNCAALPESLFESELFGHKRGAFTGADRDKEGLLPLAGTGTLFLDEISDIPPSLQPKLLRAIESKEVLPLGGVRPVRADARIIAASNRNLEKAVAAGGFREDLYFRINVLQVNLPPLSERIEDIPILVHHFIEKHRLGLRSRVTDIQTDALALLQEQEWKGNVRELENVIQRAMIVAGGNAIAVGDLPFGGAVSSIASEGLREAARGFERSAILRAIEATGGDKAEAARRLQISLASLYSKLRDDSEQDSP